MTPPPATAERLQQLKEQELRIHTVFAKLDRALAAGDISKDEYAHYVGRVYGGKQEHDLLRELHEEERRLAAGVEASRRTPATRTPLIAAGLLLVILAAMASVLLLAPKASMPSGFAILDLVPNTPSQVNAVYNQSSSVELNVTDITGLKVSGTLAGGAADVVLVAGSQRYLVYHGDASTPAYSVSTEKESYALNEGVAVTVLPDSAEYTLWLTDSTGTKTSVASGFVTSAAGAYILDALINDSGTITKATTTFIIRDDTDPSKDVPRAPAAGSVSFKDACAESCLIPATGSTQLSLDIQLSPGATLSLASLDAEQPLTNRPPALVAPVPDVNVAQGDSATLNLGLYFADPENDPLTFDFMNAPGAQIGISSGLLTVTGLTPGSSQSVVYASDGSSLVQSNLFTITVTPSTSTTTPATTENVTLNATPPNMTDISDGNITSVNITNGTTPLIPPTTPQNGTNLTSLANVPLDCSSPDPNLRPVDCLNANAARLFEESIYWESIDRAQVARITPIGNLLIRGKVYEQSTGSAGRRDFRVSYTDADFRNVPTIWVDSPTGDLHLRGSLHEENANLVPPPGSYAVINRRGIYLAYADPVTGDLYVRGNVIPYRENIND
jgi:hypothetical protein